MSSPTPPIFHRSDGRLSSFWKMQEGSGVRKDWTKQRNDLIAFNNPFSVSGPHRDAGFYKFQNALQLNSGSSHYLATQGGTTNMSGIDFNRTMIMTIGGWFKFNGQFPNENQYLVCRDDLGSNQSFAFELIRQSATSGVIGFKSSIDGSAAGSQTMAGTTNLLDATHSGRFIHVTCVLDTIGQSGGIYINGVPEYTVGVLGVGASGMFNNSSSSYTSIFSGVFPNSLDFNFGKSNAAGSTNQFRSHCAISDLFICSGVLLQSEIQSILNYGIPLSGTQYDFLYTPIVTSGDRQLVAWWRLEENGTAGRIDSSQSGNHLSVSGTVAPKNCSGMIEFGLQHAGIGGTAQGLYLRNPWASGVGTSGYCTWAGWYSKTVPTGFGHIAGVDRDGTAANVGLSLDAGAAPNIYALIRIGSGNLIRDFYMSPPKMRASGTQYHIAVVLDPYQRIMSGYFDGVPLSGLTDVSGMYQTKGQLQFSIGNRDQSSAQNSLDGTVDEFMCFRRALTSDEIASIYDFGIDISSYPAGIGKESGHIGGYIKVFDYIPDSGQIGGYLSCINAITILDSGQIAGYTFSIYAIESGQIKSFAQAATSSGTNTFTTLVPILQRSSGTFDWGFSLIGQTNEDFGAIFRVLKTTNTDFGAKLQVINSPQCPTANIWYLNPSGANAPMTIYASGSGIAYGGKIINRLEWEIPEGGRSGTEGIKFTLNSSGLQIVTLKVYDSDGLIGMDAKIINTASGAMNKLPQVQVSGSPHDGETPLSINFSGTYVAAIGDSISHKLWKFGNDQTSILSNPSTLYQSPGCWIPTVRVKSALGYIVSDLISSGVNSL